MTTGKWLIRIGNWIARKDTFDRIVAPAIADLQVEASRGMLQRWRHYFAIAAVLIFALLTDLRHDAVSAFDANARHTAWKRAAIWYAGFVAVFTCLGIRYSVPELSLDGAWSAVLTHAAFEAALTGVSLGIVPAALYLSRRSSSRRSVVLAAVIVAALTIGSAMVVRPLRMSADRTLSNRIHLINTRNADYWDQTYLDKNVTWWQDVQSGASVLPYALIGVVLSRRKGWTIVSTIGQFMATQTLIAFFVLRRVDNPPSLVSQRWHGIAVIAIVSVIWLTSDWLHQRFTQESRPEAT